MLLDWFTTRNTEVRLFVTDSTEHAFNMYNCLLRTFAPKSSHVEIFLKLWLQLQNDKIMLKK